MSYSEIDPILDRWAGEHRLPVHTSYKESDVRSIDLADEAGNRYQLWVDPPNEQGQVGVHAWDYRKRSADFQVPWQDLESALDRALRVISEWMMPPGAAG